jgi:hypothetical protein
MSGVEATEGEEIVWPAGATLQPDGTVHYLLRWPMRWKVGAQENSVSAVTVRRKTLDDNLAIEAAKGPISVQFILIKRLCGLSDIAAKRMDDVDIAAIGTIIENFTTPGLPTGETVSA